MTGAWFDVYDDLLVEFDNICSLGVVKTRKEKLVSLKKQTSQVESIVNSK
jgi:hypothetical protein